MVSTEIKDTTILVMSTLPMNAKSTITTTLSCTNMFSSLFDSEYSKESRDYPQDSHWTFWWVSQVSFVEWRSQRHCDYGGSGGTRTLTRLSSHMRLRHARLPVPPRSHMVRKEGLEPPTCGLEDRHSNPTELFAQESGAPCRTRTCDLCIRSAAL